MRLLSRRMYTSSNRKPCHIYYYTGIRIYDMYSNVPSGRFFICEEALVESFSEVLPRILDEAYVVAELYAN